MINIKKPTAIIHKTRIKRNIEQIALKVKRSGIKFRPHFKTHQSKEIGEFFKEYDVSAITVSSLDMAIYFAREGWEDITLAVPCNIKQINEINILAKKISLGLLVDSLETTRFLAKNITSIVNVWIKIDIEYHRTGVSFQDRTKVFDIANLIVKNKNLNFSGLLTHAGNSYYAKSRDELIQIHNESIKRLIELKVYLSNESIKNIQISIGDTPTCSIIEDFDGIDEIRPGSFVFYDLMHVKLGVCNENDIALAVACPVISKNLDRNEVVIYGGAIHLSKDYIQLDEHTKTYGRVAFPSKDHWSKSQPKSFVKGLSQEHGIIKMDKNIIGNINIGDILFILPVHSCLTANLYTDLYSLIGEKYTTFQY